MRGIWLRLTKAWLVANPVIRALWLFFILPSIVLGSLSLFGHKELAGLVGKWIAPLLILGAAFWLSRHPVQDSAIVDSSLWRSRFILLLLISFFSVLVIAVAIVH